MCISVTKETMQQMIFLQDSFQQKMFDGQIAVPIVGGIVCGALSLLAGAVAAIAVLIIKQPEGVEFKLQDLQDSGEGSFSYALLRNDAQKQQFAFAAANVCTAGIVGMVVLCAFGIVKLKDCCSK